MSVIYNLGRVSIVPKGTWANLNPYTFLDTVSNLGNSYIAIKNVPIGIDILNTEYWQCLGTGGEDGISPHITIGTVETLPAGSDATVTMTGTQVEPILNFGIPKGMDGLGIVQSVNNVQPDTYGDCQIYLKSLNIVIPKEGFILQSTPTYTSYPYRATCGILGVVFTMFPDIVFNVSSLDLNVLCPVCDTYNGGIYLYSKEVPLENIVIDTALFWR